jgi:hypothetical protein
VKKKPRADGKSTNVRNDLELKDVESFIQIVRDKLQKVHDTVARLPKVDSKGHSECPFAEDLYADSDKLLHEFELIKKKIPGYMNLVDQEIVRFKNNLDQLQFDTSALNTKQAKDQFHTARHAYEIHYNKYLAIKRELTDLATQSDQVLSQADNKKWPLGKPKKKPNYPMVRMNTTGPVSNPYLVGNKNPMSSGSLPSAPNEVNNLLSLGPMTNVGFNNKIP